MKYDQTFILKIVLGIFIAVSIFELDRRIELGVAGGIPYVLLILMGLSFQNKWAPIYLGILATILTIIGYYLSPQGGEEWKILLNRGYSIFAIGVTSIGVFWQRKTLDKLETYTIKLELNNNELEDKVKARTHELSEALKKEKELNEMKSRFVSMASHEFRTPLSTVLSSTSLLENYNKSDQPDKQLKHIARIRSSVKNLTNILDDFLSVDKLTQHKITLDFNRIDLKRFVQNVADELEGISQVGQIIRCSHIGETEALVDKSIIRNILLNLLSNAIKYSKKEIELITEISVNEVKITVKDQGIGIPDSEQQNIFTKFFRATNATNIQGTGLGLNIVLQYVELLNGKITFQSRQNEGSTFNIVFPQSKNFLDN